MRTLIDALNEAVEWDLQNVAANDRPFARVYTGKDGWLTQDEALNEILKESK